MKRLLIVLTFCNLTSLLTMDNYAPGHEALGKCHKQLASCADLVEANLCNPGVIIPLAAPLLTTAASIMTASSDQAGAYLKSTLCITQLFYWGCAFTEAKNNIQTKEKTE